MTSFKETSLERVEFNIPTLPPGVPLLIDDWTLAFQLGFRGKTLWYIHHSRDRLYREFKIPKSSGGMRTIHNPTGLMRTFHQQLRARVLVPLCAQLGPHVSAYQLGKSTVDAAREHIWPCEVCAQHEGEHTCQPAVATSGDAYAVKVQPCLACTMPAPHACPRHGVKVHMDLSNFFGSTRRSWIRQYFFREVGYNHYVSSLLAQLLTVPLTDPKGRRYNGVPQGAKTSGDICNLVANQRFDQRLLAEFPDWKYTRYADDLYFSHPENLPKAAVNEFIRNVERAVQSCGYRINRKKLHVQRPHTRQKLLGVILNQKINLPREQYREMRSLLHNCVRHGFESQVERAGRDSLSNLHNWITGKLSYFKLIAPAKAQRLRVIYDEACRRHPTTTTEPETT